MIFGLEILAAGDKGMDVYWNTASVHTKRRKEIRQVRVIKHHQSGCKTNWNDSQNDTHFTLSDRSFLFAITLKKKEKKNTMSRLSVKTRSHWRPVTELLKMMTSQ